MDATRPVDRFTGSRRLRRGLRWGVTLVVVALVAWFAGDTLRTGWQELSAAKIRIDWRWAVLSAAIYILGLSPMAYFWQLALRSLGETADTATVVRGYYLGHLGKYVPGKALVAVLRTGMLVQHGCDMRRVVVSVFLETLTFMATGGLLAAGLLALSGDGPAAYVWLSAGLAVLAGLPVAPPIARRLARRVMVGKDATQANNTDAALAGINWRLTAAGLGCASVAWVGVGLSLWAAVRAVGIATVSPFSQLSLWVEGVTLPVVAGFLSLIPGGLMVRDALQAELLTPLTSPALALVVAALWRLISITSETTTCVIIEASRLYRARWIPPSDTT